MPTFNITLRRKVKREIPLAKYRGRAANPILDLRTYFSHVMPLHFKQRIVLINNVSLTLNNLTSTTLHVSVEIKVNSVI